MQWLIREVKKRHKINKLRLFIFGMRRKSYMFLVNKILGVNINKIVFISFGGKSYSDNPRAISEKLHEMYPSFEIVWIFNKPDDKRKIVPDYVRCVKADSDKALKELAMAKFWVDNFPKDLYIYKSKSQKYIQTWHGDRGFKKVLYDVRTKLPNGHYKEGDLFEEKLCDLAVSGSVYGNKVYRTAFGYKGKILKVGSPRDDQLILKNYNKIKKIKNMLNIPQETKVFLYAPTFRDSKKDELQDINVINLQTILDSLENKTGDQWICLIRSHGASLGFNNVQGVKHGIKNVTDYEDMNELLLISDMLITDYSSSSGDFALLERPIILFQNDREEYLEKDRTFYFDIDESPFMVAMNQDELIQIIKKMDRSTIIKNCQDILDFYEANETGNSSEAVVNYINSKIEGAK